MAPQRVISPTHTGEPAIEQPQNQSDLRNDVSFPPFSAISTSVGNDRPRNIGRTSKGSKGGDKSGGGKSASSGGSGHHSTPVSERKKKPKKGLMLKGMGQPTGNIKFGEKKKTKKGTWKRGPKK